MIIGSMKSGTSSLFRFMSVHPQICCARVKEPEFFSENQRHGVDVARYEDLWDFDPAVHDYALEASTGYTKFPSEPNVPQRIAEYGLQPKFIYIMRNPFERIGSHFNFKRNDKRWEHTIIDQHLIATSNYFLQLNHFLKYFDRKQFLLLEVSNLASAPEKLLDQVYMESPGEFRQTSFDLVWR